MNPTTPTPRDATRRTHLPQDASEASRGISDRHKASAGLITRRGGLGGPATEGEGVADGRLAAAATPAAVGAVEGPFGGAPDGLIPLIHEHKTGSPCPTTTYVRFSATKTSDRIKRHGEHHRRALDMAKFCQNHASNRAEKLRTCGTWLQFRQYFTVDQVRVTAGMFCQQDRLCPLCAFRRAGRYMRAYVEKVRAVMEDNPKLRPYLVTRTVKDGPDLGERVGHLLRGLRVDTTMRGDYVRNCRKGYRSSSPPASAVAVGGVGSVEIKRGKGSGLWHPHHHAVWLCEQAPDVEMLRADWIGVTRDSFIVDVRPFDCVQLLNANPGDLGAWAQMAGDFCEVFKYALKFGDMSLEDNWHAFSVLFKQRLIESFGCLRGVEIPADLRDEPLAPDVPYIELLMAYHHGNQQYEARRQELHQYDPMKCCPWPRQLKKTKGAM